MCERAPHLVLGRRVTFGVLTGCTGETLFGRAVNVIACWHVVGGFSHDLRHTESQPQGPATWTSTPHALSLSTHPPSSTQFNSHSSDIISSPKLTPNHLSLPSCGIHISHNGQELKVKHQEI